jgi:hypothetical protein
MAGQQVRRKMTDPWDSAGEKTKFPIANEITPGPYQQ